MAATSAATPRRRESTGSSQPSASRDRLSTPASIEQPRARAGVAVAHAARARRARRPRACGARPSPYSARDVPLDLAQVAPRALERARRARRSPSPSRAASAWATWMREYGQDSSPRRQKREAAVVVLQRRAAAAMSRFTAASISSGSGRPSASKAVEHVPQRRHREDARGELLGALERVGDEVEHGVGQRLERGRRGGDLQAAELGDDVGRRLHRLGDRALVDLAVGGERLGGGRRPDRQRRRSAGVGASARRPRPPGSARCPARHRGHGEAHLHAVVGGHLDAAARPRRSSAALRGPHGDVHRQRGVGLVLQHDRQLEAVAEVQEPRRRRAHHQRQARGDRRLAGAEASPPGGGHRHHAVAGQVVGQLHRAPRRARRASVGTLAAKSASALKSVRMRMAGSGPVPRLRRRASPCFAPGAAAARRIGAMAVTITDSATRSDHAAQPRPPAMPAPSSGRGRREQDVCAELVVGDAGLARRVEDLRAGPATR